MKILPTLVPLALTVLAAPSAADSVLYPTGPMDVGAFAGLYLLGPTGTGIVRYSLGRLNPPLVLALGERWLSSPTFFFASWGTTTGTPQGFFFSVPSSSALIGAQAWLQAIVDPSAAGPLELSNCVHVRLGPLAGIGPLQNVPFELFGRSIAAGDHDGDGADEIVVGVPGATTSFPSLNSAGKVAIYSGSPLALLTDFDAGPAQGGGRFGYSVAMGQLDGIAGEDLIVSEPLWDASGTVTDVGRVHVYFAPGYSSPTAFTAGPGFFGQDFGWTVQAVDFDGDGDTSIVVGAPAHLVSQAGVVYVYDYVAGITPAYSLTEPSGGASFGKVVAAGDFASASGLELAVADFERANGGLERGTVYVYSGTSALPSLTSPSPVDYGHFGESLAAGDFDADGLDDLVIGAPGEGKVYVYSYDGSAWALVADVTTPGPSSSATFGNGVLAADLDGDSADDLVVGQIGSSGVGRAWVHFGTSGQTLTERIFGVIGDNDSISTLFGQTLAVGDADGDGNPELYCGAVTKTTGFADSGKVFVATF